jgi:hypothetical protein
VVPFGDETLSAGSRGRSDWLAHVRLTQHVTVMSRANHNTTPSPRYYSTSPLHSLPTHRTFAHAARRRLPYHCTFRDGARRLPAGLSTRTSRTPVGCLLIACETHSKRRWWWHTTRRTSSRQSTASAFAKSTRSCLKASGQPPSGSVCIGTTARRSSPLSRHTISTAPRRCTSRHKPSPTSSTTGATPPPLWSPPPLDPGEELSRDVPQGRRPRHFARRFRLHAPPALLGGHRDIFCRRPRAHQTRQALEGSGRCWKVCIVKAGAC